MQVEIREFTAGDYPGLVELSNLIYPDHLGTVEEWRFWEERRDPKCAFRRWIAVIDGRIVGAANYEQQPWMFHTRKFYVDAIVHPEHRRLGIGGDLFETAVRALDQFDPLVIRSAVREDQASGLVFLGKRGYSEERRIWESELDVTAFDESRFAGTDAKARSDGVVIRTLKELIATDAGWERKLHALEVEAGRDVPRPDEYTPVEFEQFQRVHHDNPSLIPEAYFVAVIGEDYVGLSNLWKRQADAKLNTGLTAVLPSQRRKGIALALKLRAIAYAKSHGAPALTTGNESTNVPMLSINNALGFERKPAWVGFVKVIKGS